ncbi:MAG: hypothetical protein AAF805_15495 [Planctomycetota bacterium]
MRCHLRVSWGAAVAALFGLVAAGATPAAAQEPSESDVRQAIEVLMRASAAQEDDDHDDDDDHDHEDHDDGDHDDDDHFDLDLELGFAEMERAAVESAYGALELVEQLAEIASSPELSAALAVTSIPDAFERDRAIALLKEVVEKAPSEMACRLARMRLAELHGEEGDDDAVEAQLRALIFSGE